MKRSAFAALAVLVLAACGGGGGSTISPGNSNGGGSGGSGGGGGVPPTSPPGGTAITLSITGGGLPTVAAMQTGTGPWTKITLTGSSAAFTVPAGTSRYGVAMVCGKTTEFIELLTIGDTTSPSMSCSAGGGVSQSLGFDVSAIRNATNADLYIGSDFQEETAPKGTGEIKDVPTGTQDVGLIAFDDNGNPLAVKIERGVDVTGGPLAGVSATNADLTGQAALTLSAPPSGYTTVVNDWYQTASGADFELQDGASTTSYPTIAAADTQSDDVYHVEAFAQTNAAPIPSEVGVFSTFAAAQSQTLNYPAPLSYGGPNPAQYPSFSIPAYNGFNISGNVVIQLAIFASQASIVTGTSPAYFKLAGNSVAIPNLSSLGGFLRAPSSGNRETWILGEHVSTTPLDGNYLIRQPATTTSLLEYAQEAGEFTVP